MFLITFIFKKLKFNLKQHFYAAVAVFLGSMAAAEVVL
jgi:hypothetical protein